MFTIIPKGEKLWFKSFISSVWVISRTSNTLNHQLYDFRAEVRCFEIYHLFLIVKFAKFSSFMGLKKGNENVTNEVEQFFSASFYFIDVIQTLK